MILITESDDGSFICTHPESLQHGVGGTQNEAIDDFWDQVSGFVEEIDDRFETVGPGIKAIYKKEHALFAKFENGEEV